MYRRSCVDTFHLDMDPTLEEVQIALEIVQGSDLTNELCGLLDEIQPLWKQAFSSVFPFFFAC